MWQRRWTRECRIKLRSLRLAAKSSNPPASVSNRLPHRQTLSVSQSFGESILIHINPRLVPRRHQQTQFIGEQMSTIPSIGAPVLQTPFIGALAGLNRLYDQLESRMLGKGG